MPRSPQPKDKSSTSKGSKKAPQTAQEQAKAEAIVRARAQAVEQARKEAKAEAIAKAKKEAHARARAKALAKAKAEAVAKAKKEAYAKAKAEALKKAKAQPSDKPQSKEQAGSNQSNSWQQKIGDFISNAAPSPLMGFMASIFMWCEHLFGQIALAPFFPGLAVTTGLMYFGGAMAGLMVLFEIGSYFSKGPKEDSGDKKRLWVYAATAAAMHFLYYGMIEFGYALGSSLLAVGGLITVIYAAAQAYYVFMKPSSEAKHHGTSIYDKPTEDDGVKKKAKVQPKVDPKQTPPAANNLGKEGEAQPTAAKVTQPAMVTPMRDRVVNSSPSLRSSTDNISEADLEEARRIQSKIVNY